MYYRTNDLAFSLPGAGWVDGSVHRLTLATPDGQQLSVEITRSPAVGADALDARVAHDIEDQRRRLRGFELLDRQAFESRGVRGAAITFRMLAPEGAMLHELAYVPLSTGLVVFRVTAPARHAATCRDALRAIVETLEL